MDDRERARYTYARQKLWEVLQCLVSTQPVTKRIIAAAGPLFHLKLMHSSLVDELPHDARTKFDEIIGLLSRHPLRSGEDSLIEASAERLSHHQRRRITENVIDIYVTISGGL